MSACVVVVVAMVAAINLALPKLSRSELAPSSTDLLWIVDAYLLVFGCLLIPAGALGDRLGRKGVLITGLSVFALGCAASAAAPGVPLLVAGRAVTGLGAALVMPATLSLLLQVTEAERRPQAIATWTAATGAAGALGNLGGGVILQWLPWQGLFLVAAPVAGALAIAVAYVAPRGERHPASLDPVGVALLTATVLAVLLGTIAGPDQGWTSPLVLGSLGASTVLFALFLAWSWRATDPLLDPRIFAVPALRVGAFGVGAVFFGLFALFFVNAQYLQFAKGYPPLVTGLAILPLPTGMILVSRRSIDLVARGGPQVVAGGMVLIALGLTGLSFATASTPYLPYAAMLVAVAAGMGLSVPSLSTGIMRSVPSSRAGMGSGLNSAAREIGAALGIAVVGTVLASSFADAVPSSIEGEATSTAQALRAAGPLGPSVQAEVVHAFTTAMAAGYRVIATVVLVAALAVWRGLRDRNRAEPVPAVQMVPSGER